MRDARLVLGHLARAVGVERAADRVRQAVLVVERAAVDLARELREAVRRVRRRAVAQVLLGGGKHRGALEHHRRRHVHQALDPLARAPPGRRRCRAPWFTSSSVYGSLWKFAMPPTIAARCTTCEQPVDACARAGVRRSPRHLARLRIQSGAVALIGDADVPAAPRAAGARPRAPIVPAPPVTRTRLSSRPRVAGDARTPEPRAGDVPRVHEQRAPGSRGSRPSKAEWFVATTTASAPLDRRLERLGLGRDVRVVARHVRQLALQQADQLVGERVAHVVRVALEGEAEHGDLAVAQRAAEPRFSPFDEEQRHRLVHARDREQHARRARALLGEREVLAQARARREPRRAPCRRAGSRG